MRSWFWLKSLVSAALALAACSSPQCFEPCVKFHTCVDTNMSRAGAEQWCDWREGDICVQWTQECIDCVNANRCERYECVDAGFSTPLCVGEMPACKQCRYSGF